LRIRVEKSAKQWTQYSGCRIYFWGTSLKRRISGSASIVPQVPGPMSDYASRISNPLRATMNFGWLTPDTEDSEYQRVVLHEFGHALGLLHEHQHPRPRFPGIVRLSMSITNGHKDGTRQKSTKASLRNIAKPRQITLSTILSRSWNIPFQRS